MAVATAGAPAAPPRVRAVPSRPYTAPRPPRIYRAEISPANRRGARLRPAAGRPRPYEPIR
ncbi:hypothetical protein ADK43_40070 [Streptomyces rimosus subsp. rimosus]|nr:hypothetical protein ADK43_40070 [Streptomyces rimosus subsp. rimosus]